MLLQDKVAIITGAASQRGIGKATAKLFAAHGARVALLDIDETAVQMAARDIGPAHRGYLCDVRDREGCFAVAGQVVCDFGRIDILVNNAGLSRPTRIADIAPEEYDLVLDTNLKGSFLMSQAVIPHMRAQKSGAIICMSSVSAERGGGIFGGSHYSTAKAGAIGLARAMARELAGDGIRVNAVAPGMIDTDIYGGKLTEEQRRSVLQAVPMGRLGTADDVAGVFLFLASALSGYVTGAVIDINGGSHIG